MVIPPRSGRSRNRPYSPLWYRSGQLLQGDAKSGSGVSVRRGIPMTRNRQEVGHESAWERYMEAERRDLEARRGGHLARLLGIVVSSEPDRELERFALEDQRRAQEGLVELRDSSGELSHKHIDELSPEDRPARAEAERVRAAWLKERLKCGEIFSNFSREKRLQRS